MEFELSQKEVKEAFAGYIVNKLCGKKKSKDSRSPINAKSIEKISFNKEADRAVIVTLKPGNPLNKRPTKKF